MAKEMIWSMQGPNFLKFLMELGDKEKRSEYDSHQRRRGIWGLSRVPMWRKLGHKQVAAANQGKRQASRKNAPPKWGKERNGSEESGEPTVWDVISEDRPEDSPWAMSCDAQRRAHVRKDSDHKQWAEGNSEELENRRR